ncbi:ferredoxin--NADP reductase [Paraburkholderia phosphatilytica]|uniref:ferredoxin--NADP reductase n=1 Tax=Paraburkholderia phosphatilytica TaxID=2282883 RepID=UPI000E509C15|nr:ferredoxin--NADP reductase [Paraburkholderia phosphatilytica]
MPDSDKYTVETITHIHTWVPDKLFSIRTTRPPQYRFVAGQFARLGVDKTGDSSVPVVWRAYSIVSAPYDEHLEFFSIVVPGGEFTSELSRLAVGDPLYLERTNYGFLTTDRFECGKDLWLLSSGTGLAPFVSILYDVKTWEDYERVVLVHSVREPGELAYRPLIEALGQHEYFGEYAARKLTYVPVVTRVPVRGALGKRITELVDTGELEQFAGTRFDHDRSRIMLCGNPDMVEDLRRQFTVKGFTVSKRGKPGHLAVENYW